MKKVFLLFALLLTSVGIWAQKKAAVYVEDGSDQPTIVAEVDWTEKSEWDGFWYSSPAEVSVEQGTGLIIDCTQESPETANYWEPQVPIIQNIPYLNEGGQYQVRFTLDSPVAGELRLDLASWDGTGATLAQTIPVVEGESEYWVSFFDYPTECTDAFLFFQCGKLPGKHIIKNVQVVDLEGGTYEPRHTYSVIGTINGEWDTDWEMYKDGSNYITIIEGIAAGCYEFKVRQDYKWDTSWGLEDGSNCEVCVDNDNSRVIIIFNPETGKIDWEVSYRPHDYSLDTVLDWTQYNSYYGDVWYSDNYSTVSVETGLGLIIDSNPPEDGEIYDVQVPIVAHIPEILEGGNYEMTFTVNAPAAGDIRLDFCSWDGSDATLANQFYVEEGDNTLTLYFSDYPDYCTNAMIFYQCGHVPGRHIIKDVQVSYLGGGAQKTISPAYYLIGNPTGWTTDGARTQKFNHSEYDVNEDPYFSIEVETGGDDCYFAIADDAALEAIDTDSDWTKLIGPKGAQEDLSGKMNFRYKLGSDACFHLVGVSKFRMTINMRNYDYWIEPTYLPVDTLPYQYKEWAGETEYPYSYSNPDGFTANIGEEGVEFFNPGENGDWSPYSIILKGASLIAGHNYKVVVTAKIPSDGYMEVNLGNDNWGRWENRSVTASDEFQTIEYMFNSINYTCNRNAYIGMDCYLPGTTIIQKVEIYDMIPQEAIAYQSKDWTNCSEKDLLWYQFAEDQTGTVKATADGIAITNNERWPDYWQPQTMVIDSIVLKPNHRYIVRVTAKNSSGGDLYLKVGNWSNFDQYSTYVDPSNDFQEYDFDFWWYSNEGYGDDHILFQNGYIVGTSVVKKIEIFDMSMLTEYDIMAMTGKINVRDTQVLDFPEETDPNFKPEINLKSGDRWSFGHLTLNGYVPAISDISMWYDFGWATYYGRWYEDLQQWDNDREYFTSFVNNAATSIDDAKVTIRLYPQRWEFITMPFDVALKDVKGSNGRPFVVRKYDGQKRAEGLLDETWVDMTEDDILEAGVGYIWQTDRNNNYTDWYEDGFNTFTLRPVKNASLDRVLGNENVTVPLTVHEGEQDYNLGWNLIGNPYPSYFDSRAMTFSAPFIVWSNYHDNYEAFSPVDDAYILNPGQAFFVQSTEDQSSITFLKEGRQSNLEVRSDVNYVKHARQTSAAAERTVVNFIVSDGEIGDRTRVVINPEASLAYEADKDASKFASSEAKIQLYTIEQNVKYAINERPLSKGDVQLGLTCATRGTYTLTMRTSADCMVKLFDRLTGEEVMLANTDTYTFESETGVFDNRFTLYFTSGEATGIQNFSSTQDTNDTYYDMQGRRISKPEKGIYIQNGKKVVVK